MDGVQTLQGETGVGLKQGAKMPAAVDTLRWGEVCPEMDSSPSVPSNPRLGSLCPALPSPRLPFPPLLSWRVFVWREFRLFLDGSSSCNLIFIERLTLSMNQTLVLSPPPPPLPLPSSSRCENPLCLHLTCSHRRAVFRSLLFCFKHVHASLSSVYVILTSILII